jgi:hypothetical protein
MSAAVQLTTEHKDINVALLLVNRYWHFFLALRTANKADSVTQSGHPEPCV